MMDIEALRRGAENPVQAVRGDLPAVAADLSDAFADDVMFDWFLRTDDRRDEARLRFFNFVITNLIFGPGRIERPPVGGAAAIWMPFEALAPTPLMTELRAVPVLLHATGLARFSRLAAVRATMDANHPMDRPHAYLMFLGVSRAAQGRGVGSRLLKVGVDRCDAAGLPAYLETQTERNIALYRRHGFEVTAETRPRPDAPPLWSMWREPRVWSEGEPSNAPPETMRL
jgi:ribosomal protein S18 acetylase RimI-like enzyme